MEPASPRTECPKCGAACRDGQTACAKCGLASERMDSFAAERDAAVPDVLSLAWDRAIAGWEDPARHDEVFRLVTTHDAYAWAAARYRAHAGDPIGERQIARLRKAAEATMLATAATRKETAPKPYRALTAVMIMLIVAAAAGLLYANVMTDSAPAPGGTVPAEPIRETAPAGTGRPTPPVTSPPTK